MCRSHLSNRFKLLNEVLVYKAMSLIQKSMIWSKGKVNKKLQDFIQACCAYVYISLIDLPSKKVITISIHAAQVTTTQKKKLKKLKRG